MKGGIKGRFLQDLDVSATISKMKTVQKKNSWNMKPSRHMIVKRRISFVCQSGTEVI
jgi:hypothetical protein